MSFLLKNLLFVMLILLGYRRNVVRQNLSIINKDSEGVNTRRDFYRFRRYFARLFSEIILSYFQSEQSIRKRVFFENASLVQNSMNSRGGAFLLTAHYGNWELASLALPAALNGNLGAVYLPLSNKKLDNWVKQKRVRFGVQFISPRDLLLMLRRKMTCKAICFVADQAPGGPENADWIYFFDKLTAFSPGIERLPRMTGWPVYYASIRPISGRNYHIEFELITDDPERCEKGEILRSYVNCLEREIRKNPSHWLLSHRRWKHDPENFSEKVVYERYPAGRVLAS